MKSEQQVRDRIKELEEMKVRDPEKAVLYDRWIDMLNWVLEEYCQGLDCAWCTNYECPCM